jgi:transcriptional regulator with GAF, ATPase, and Fis domain
MPGPNGTLFIDEIGELPLSAQTSLLRPCQDRAFVVLGETRPRPIEGRLLFATNRDLEAECRNGSFRLDLHARLDVVPVHMPPLRAILRDAPGQLRVCLRGFVARRFDTAERIDRMTDEIEAHLRVTRPDDPWVGNLRALGNYVEQYILTRGQTSVPAVRAAAVSAPAAAPTPEAGGRPESRAAVSSGAVSSGAVRDAQVLGPRAAELEVDADELLRVYVSWAHARSGGNKAETARVTGMDKRTVGRYLDYKRVARWMKAKLTPKGKGKPEKK